MRIPAMAVHASAAIEWVNASLPDLALLLARAEKFDLVMLSAVWMHLDEAQRQRAMPNLAALVRTEGAVIMKLRHGPVPAGRRMFEVSSEETIELAQAHGLQPVLNMRTESTQQASRLPGITWTKLAFGKEQESTPHRTTRCVP